MLRIKSTIYLTGQVKNNNQKTNNKQITMIKIQNSKQLVFVLI